MTMGPASATDGPGALPGGEIELRRDNTPQRQVGALRA